MTKRQARGTRIRELREDAGLMQATFAESIGISVTYLSRIETGERTNPSPVVLKAIADQLGVALDDISTRMPINGTPAVPA